MENLGHKNKSIVG